jgi:uncharacterized protein
MKDKYDRRSFLTAGLILPMASMAPKSFLDGPSATADKTAPPKSAPLQYRVLGKTGLKVTSMGFGCMVTSDPSVIEKAADMGVNFFDTARVYQSGNNEKMVGAALKSHRKNLILCTKTGASHKAEALAHLETSLKELGTDYVDIWHLHGKSKPEHLSDDLMEAQVQAKKEGKIRFAGVSVHSGHAEIFPAIAEKKNHFDVLLSSYNFSMEPAMESLVEKVAAAGIGIIGMKVMAGGFRRPKPGDKAQEILKREGAMLAALKWVLRNKNIGTTIPSITDMEQLDQDLQAMSVPYAENDTKLLAAQLEYIRPLYCRSCGGCAGQCPQGLPVSEILRYLSYADGYGQYALGRESFQSLPEEIRAVRCGDCGSCAIHCPNGVQVSGRLQKAQEWFA